MVRRRYLAAADWPKDHTVPSEDVVASLKAAAQEHSEAPSDETELAVFQATCRFVAHLKPFPYPWRHYWVESFFLSGLFFVLALIGGSAMRWSRRMRGAQSTFSVPVQVLLTCWDVLAPASIFYNLNEVVFWYRFHAFFDNLDGPFPTSKKVAGPTELTQPAGHDDLIDTLHQIWKKHMNRNHRRFWLTFGRSGINPYTFFRVIYLESNENGDEEAVMETKVGNEKQGIRGDYSDAEWETESDGEGDDKVDLVQL